MVRAILDGRKFQTRRILNPQPPTPEKFSGSIFGLWHAPHCDPDIWDMTGSVGVARDAGFPVKYRCPYGAVSSKLWVRETWGAENWNYIRQYKAEPWRGEPCRDGAGIRYRATEKDPGIFPKGFWKPNIHMFRWACRLELEITKVKVERLNDISSSDARDEGVDTTDFLDTARTAHRDKWITRYRVLWDSINGNSPAKAWAENPWVWKIVFRKIEP